MNYKFPLGLATAAMLFAGCGDDSVTRSYDEAKSEGDITLKIVDSNTGLAIDSVNVYSLINKQGSFSDSLGVSLWQKNSIGQYEYTFTKEGYATRTVNVELTEDSDGDIARVEDKVTIVPMYKLGVSVKGTVLLKHPQNGNLSAAANVPVVLTYTNGFIIPQEVITKTNASGVYEFEDLAEGLTYSVSVPQVTFEKQTYAYDSKKNVGEALREGEKRTLDQITMEVVGLTPEIINSNLAEINIADSVAITFSTTLNADSVPNAWKVVKGDLAKDDLWGDVINVCSSNGTSVLTSAKLDDDNKTVIIKPISGTWTKLATYCISGTVYTKEGKSFEVVKTFVPGSAVSQPDIVTGTSASWYYNDYIRLQWKPNGNEINGYKVYFKTNLSADYEEYSDWRDGALPIDSVKCSRVKDYTAKACSAHVELYGDPSRYETNYYWRTEYKEVSEEDDYTKTGNRFIWTETSAEKDTFECSQESSYDYGLCEEYEKYGSYDDRIYDIDNEVYVFKWFVNKTLEKPDTCVTASTYYEECEQYDSLGTIPKRETVYYTPIDSVSCTVKDGDYYSESKDCQAKELLYERDYDSRNYNIFWYSKFSAITPNALSQDAFVKKSDVFDSDNITNVKFIVLPYVNVSGEVITANPLSATPASINILED